MMTITAVPEGEERFAFHVHTEDIVLKAQLSPHATKEQKDRFFGIICSYDILDKRGLVDVVRVASGLSDAGKRYMHDQTERLIAWFERHDRQASPLWSRAARMTHWQAARVARSLQAEVDKELEVYIRPFERATGPDHPEIQDDWYGVGFRQVEACMMYLTDAGRGV